MNRTTTTTIAALTVLAFLPLLADPACADELEVPVNYPSIQSAIDAAQPDDLIVVGPGVYPEAINFFGKAITIVSTDGPDATTIGPPPFGSIVSFVNGESATSVIDGFRIAGAGYPVFLDEAHGMDIDGASPTVLNCQIVNNTWAGITPFEGGAGVRINNGAPTFTNCLIDHNLTINTGGNGTRGGGILISNGFPTFTSCQITANVASDDCIASGGGMALDLSTVTLQDCIVADNVADASSCESSDARGGGIATLYSTINIFNTTFENNRAVSSENPCGNSWGGGLFIGIAGLSEVLGSSFEHNEAVSDLGNCPGDGGAVYNQGVIGIANLYFCGNVPDDFGGFPADQAGNTFDDECVLPCFGDIDDSGSVGIGDLLELLAQWGGSGSADIAPKGGDGIVGVNDLLAVLAAWGDC